MACQGTILFQRLLVSFHFLDKIDALRGKGELDLKLVDSAVPIPVSVSVVIKGDFVIMGISGTTSLLEWVCPGVSIPGGGGDTPWTWDLG